MKQRYVKRPVTDNESVNYLMSKGLSQEIAQLLASRGINADCYDDFVSDKDVFHSPFDMANMSAAVETINYVIECGGSILIYGDYDADGLTASSILSLYFTDNGVANDVIIPTRDEGYGLHAENVFRAFENNYYAGTPALSVKKVGKGKVYYFGAAFAEDCAKVFIELEKLSAPMDLDSLIDMPESVELAVRGEYIFILNYGEERIEMNCSAGFKNMISGETYSEKITIEGYDAVVLKLI